MALNFDLTQTGEKLQEIIDRGDDKDYAPTDFSGMGRVFLSPNIQEVDGEDKNILTQDVFCLEDGVTPRTNTIYIIQYDYTMTENITIPENCILKFVGGSISNGTITGQNTCISAELVKIFDTDITLNGTWNIEDAYPEWFGAITDDDSFDCSVPINAVINNTPFRKVSLCFGKTYHIHNSIVLKSKDFSFGCPDVLAPGHKDFEGKKPGAYIMSNGDITALRVPEAAQSLSLYGIIIYQRWAYRFTGVGIDFENSTVNSCKLQSVIIAYFNIGLRNAHDSSYSGFSLNHFSDCSFSANLVGMMLYHSEWEENDRQWWMNLNVFENCHFDYNAYKGLHIQGVSSCESNKFVCCGFESNGRNLGSEGWPSDNHDNDICGIKITSNEGRGITTFDNCYFEINLSGGTNNTQTIEETNENTSETNLQADVIAKGAQLHFMQSAFNYGMSPIVYYGSSPVKVKVENCDIKYLAGDAYYKSNNIILLKNGSFSSFAECYIDIVQPALNEYWQEEPIKSIGVSGLTYFKIHIVTPYCQVLKGGPKVNGNYDPYDETTTYSYYCTPVDDRVNVIRVKKQGQTSDRPDIPELSPNQNLHGFMYFDRTLHKPIWWNGDSNTWVNAEGEDPTTSYSQLINTLTNNLVNSLVYTDTMSGSAHQDDYGNWVYTFENITLNVGDYYRINISGTNTPVTVIVIDYYNSDTYIASREIKNNNGFVVENLGQTSIRISMLSWSTEFTQGNLAIYAVSASIQYNEAQSLTAQQKITAQGNLGLKGDTASRPQNLTSINSGLQYFDTTLGKPIYWSGTAWVDATGASV